MEYIRTVNTQSGDVVVRKLKIKEYALVLRELKELPKKLGDFGGGKTNEQILEVLPEVISTALPEVCRIFALASDKDQAFFEEMYLDDLVDVFAALYEINDFNKVGDTLKKTLARKAQ